MSDVIYKPKGRALEYAEWACNIYRGCGHGCTYCYAPGVVRMKREAFYKNPQVRKNFFERLEKDIANWKGQKPQVLLSFTSDPYQPAEAETEATLQTIRMLHEGGFSVCVLTKAPAFAWLRDRFLFNERDAIATTLTFSAGVVKRSQEWEPGAELPIIRMLALKEFHLRGIPTWVSLEPVIDPEETLKVIYNTYPYVGLYKVGKLNYVKAEIDWHRFANEVVELLENLGANYMIKEGLREYL